MNNKFNWQSFISIGLLLSFVIMFISGIVLYIAPEGSLSRWIAWDVLNLSKKQWEHQHTIFSYVFILFSVFHVFKINWTYLISYFLLEKFKISNLKEILIAVIITVFVFMGTLFNWSPFRTVLQFGSKISENYGENVEISNIPDAEKLTLNEFANQVFNITYSDLEKKLGEFNFKSIDKNSTVMKFCKQNNVSPEKFYKVLKSEVYSSKKSDIEHFPNISSYSSYFGNKKSIL